MNIKDENVHWYPSWICIY